MAKDIYYGIPTLSIRLPNKPSDGVGLAGYIL
jgi:hypothetical protein